MRSICAALDLMADERGRPARVFGGTTRPRPARRVRSRLPSASATSVTRDESRKRVAGRVERRVRRKTNARGRVSTERRRARSRRRDACFSSPQELSSLISRVAFFAEHEKMIIPSTDKTLHELNTTCSFNPFRISPRPMGSRARRFSAENKSCFIYSKTSFPSGSRVSSRPFSIRAPITPSRVRLATRPSRVEGSASPQAFPSQARPTAARPLETKHPAGREPKASAQPNAPGASTAVVCRRWPPRPRPRAVRARARRRALAPRRPGRASARGADARARGRALARPVRGRGDRRWRIGQRRSVALTPDALADARLLTHDGKKRIVVTGMVGASPRSVTTWTRSTSRCAPARAP